MYGRTIKNKDKDTELTFGVSGCLYESNVLLYDHQTESLWSQLKEEAVTGPMTGTRLPAVPSVLTTWKQWQAQHPGTLVLSTQTGHDRNYDYSPSEAYARHPSPLFPIENQDDRLALKERIIGVSLNGKHKAYSLTALKKRGTPLDDHIGERAIQVSYDAEAKSARIVDGKSGEILPSVIAYWFAWASFHPQASVYGQESQTGQ